MAQSDQNQTHQNDDDYLSPAQDNNAAPSTNDAASEQSDEHSVRIQIIEQELERTKDQMIRAIADADNTRKRALREREDATKFAISGFSKDLLSVADNLRRALQAIPADVLESQPDIKNLVNGIEATERELLRSFEKNGIQKIEPLDERFDPNFHEVIFEAAIPNKPAGIVIQVVEAGYVLNGRILRPARVGVAKGDGSATAHSIDTQA